MSCLALQTGRFSVLGQTQRRAAVNTHELHILTTNLTLWTARSDWCVVYDPLTKRVTASNSDYGLEPATDFCNALVKWQRELKARHKSKH